MDGVVPKGNLSADGRREMTRLRGRKGCLIARLSFLCKRGIAYGARAYGNGALIVVRGRESRSHGEGGQVFKTPNYRGMRNAKSQCSSERHQETRNER